MYYSEERGPHIVVAVHNSTYVDRIKIADVNFIYESHQNRIHRFMYAVNGAVYQAVLFCDAEDCIWDTWTDCLSDIANMRGNKYVMDFYGIDITDI